MLHASEARPLTTNIDHLTERAVREAHVPKLDHRDAFDPAASVARGIALDPQALHGLAATVLKHLSLGKRTRGRRRGGEGLNVCSRFVGG